MSIAPQWNKTIHICKTDIDLLVKEMLLLRRGSLRSLGYTLQLLDEKNNCLYDGLWMHILRMRILAAQFHVN